MSQPFPRRFRVAVPLLLLVLAGCEVGDLVLATDPWGRDSRLRSGSYDYRAWSDAYRGEAWGGRMEVRVAADGRITGTYRLPRQCVDGWRREVDCVGRLDGRIERDGRLRFGLDEGWLSHEGNADRFSDVTGRWWTRVLGYADGGTFELRARGHR
jgi:hypothetical protein